MADLQLRRLERKAAEGDTDAAARQLLMRVRAGQLPSDHIVWASHLGCPIARLIEENPQITVECSNCRSRRERQRRRNRDPRNYPTPIRETPRDCMRCRGAKHVRLDRGLIKFVQQVEDVPQRLLIAWAADCAEHQLRNLSPKNPNAFHGRYRLPNQPERDPTLKSMILPAVRCWLESGTVNPVLYQYASGNASVYHDSGTPQSLAVGVVRTGIEDEARTVRFRLAGVASNAYHAAGGTKEERTWQERRLIHYLLG